MSRIKPSRSERTRMDKLREALLEQGANCLCCGVKLKKANISIDHIRPKSLGYIADEDNIQGLCKACNEKKGMLSINYKTKTFIVEPYLFSLTREKLLEILTLGSPKASLIDYCRQVRRAIICPIAYSTIRKPQVVRVKIN